MATKSNTKTTDSPPVPLQISADLAHSLASADSIAAERVQNLQWICQARVSRLSRTVASLKFQYGPDNAEVKAAETAVAAANITAVGARMMHLRLTTVDPEVAKNGWALHGHLFNAQGDPVSGFTVFLVDATRTYQQAYGFSYTDDQGYFLMKSAAAGSESSDKSRTETQEQAPPQLFVEVVDAKARPVYLSTTAFEPALGTATYHGIALQKGDQALGDPPPEIRDIAFPTRKKGKKR